MLYNIQRPCFLVVFLRICLTEFSFGCFASVLKKQTKLGRGVKAEVFFPPTNDKNPILSLIIYTLLFTKALSTLSDKKNNKICEILNHLQKQLSNESFEFRSKMENFIIITFLNTSITFFNVKKSSLICC